MKLIIGLGNPGKTYEETRHNVGFKVLDLLRESLAVSEWKLEPRYKALVAEAKDVLLIKPQTFMNLSGQAVWPIKKFFKVAMEDVLVIYDDMAFSVGTVKVRKSGGTGGHNGLKSVIESLGSEKFPRIRIGIGESGAKEGAEHVLGKFSPDEKKVIDEVLKKASYTAELFLQKGIEEAMNEYDR